jgi:hypothetical protein
MAMPTSLSPECRQQKASPYANFASNPACQSNYDPYSISSKGGPYSTPKPIPAKVTTIPSPATAKQRRQLCQLQEFSRMPVAKAQTTQHRHNKRLKQHQANHATALPNYLVNAVLDKQGVIRPSGSSYKENMQPSGKMDVPMNSDVSHKVMRAPTLKAPTSKAPTPFISSAMMSYQLSVRSTPIWTYCL